MMPVLERNNIYSIAAAQPTWLYFDLDFPWRILICVQPDWVNHGVLLSTKQLKKIIVKALSCMICLVREIVSAIQNNIWRQLLSQGSLCPMRREHVWRSSLELPSCPSAVFTCETYWLYQTTIMQFDIRRYVCNIYENDVSQHAKL